jgi:Raf kinase inhibitor-like YbhB/YbcL family protein
MSPLTEVIEAMETIEIRSSSFAEQGFIPIRHTRDDENVSPAIEWIRVPAEAAELLLVCEDPDAPGGAVPHWLVTGISAHAPGVAENSTPLDGREWLNDFGEVGWCGPAPRGDQPHRYLFHLFALSEPIHLPKQPSAEDVHGAADGVALGRGTLIGWFQL